jgi:hypothetical protein
LPLFAAALAGWLLAPSGALLVGLAGAAIGAGTLAAACVLARMPRRPDDGRVARFIEERAETGGVSQAVCAADALVSAVQVAEAPDQHAAGFADLIVGHALRMLRQVDPSAVISPAAMRRAATEAAAGAVVLSLASAVAFPFLLRAGATAWVALVPHGIQISVLTGNARVPAGRPLRIAAVVQGRGARLLPVVPTLVVAADGQERSVAMIPSSEGFAYEFDSIDRSFEYKVVAGASTSASYSVTALVPPRITRIDLRYEYPAFTGLGPRQEEGAGDIYGPAGTRVQLLVHTDKPVAMGEIALASGRAAALAGRMGTTVEGNLLLARDDTYRVRLTDGDGLHSIGDVEYFIRLMDDRPPDVRIVRPSSDQGVTPLEEISIEARADDDHGVAELDLVYTVAGRAPRVVPFTRVTGTEVEKIGTYLLETEGLRVQPGDVITGYALARDVARGKRSTETRSDIFFLEVKPFNEEFVSAQSQAMGGGGAAANQIESLIAAQKEIINATWNLERRSGAGRSAEDLKAVGQAQAELKARAEQVMRGGRPAYRGVFPQQHVNPWRPISQRSGGPDPIRAAVAAMGRAVEQLQRERTADAIPHEMAALQGLLQAQAEVRRREVMQQASGPGQGGSNRADRDLSALFDRELQRQQRTNYETPRQSGETPERRDTSDALDRVRDLARRQQELARRQRELATTKLPADEIKRQLERLTREQEELRKQAEELEQRLRDQRAATEGRKSAPGDQGRSAEGARGAQEMRRAAEQMRNAAEDMQRQDAAGAAASGEAAAESLRQMERQIRGDSPDARQRAAGEIQLEAQQIAEGQRRVAAEAARLEKEGQDASGRTTDALRRLAAEKDRLAERVEELQRGTRQLERDLPGEAGAPFRDAGKQLQDQRIGSRMRDSAQQMRERAESAAKGREGKPGSSQGLPAGAVAAPGPQAGLSRLEQDLSRALDSVVDTLGGKSQGDARRLMQELDRAREMRERLDRLERQVREAEAKAKAAGGSPGSTGQAGEGERSGRRGSPGGRQAGNGNAEQQLREAREEYSRELLRTRDALGRAQAEQRGGLDGSTPEHHEYSRSAPGNEAFKQDFSGWEALRRDIDLAMDKYETAVTGRLARRIAEDRLSAGGSERVPDAYRSPVSRYFESIAKVKK